MKKMKKGLKTILVGVLTAVSVLLAACGGNGDGGGGKTQTTIDTPWWTTKGELSKNDDGSINFQNVELRLLTIVTGGDLTPLTDIVNTFNKANKGKINIEVEAVNETKYAEQVANRIQFNQFTPDILMTHTKLQKGLASKEYIQPLDEIIEATGYQIDWNDYSETFAKDSNLGYANANFIVPIDMQSEVVLYNKQMLEELNMAVPQTRDEFLAVCEAFKEANTGKSNMNAVLMPTEKGHFHNYVYPTAYVQNGGVLYNEETYKAEWTAEQNLEAFRNANESILSLQRAGYMKLGEEEESAMLRFYENKGLFLFIPPWRITSSGQVLENYAKKNGISITASDYMTKICERIGGMSLARIFAMDSNAASAEYVYVDSHSFSVSNTVKDITKKAACLEFIMWFTENAQVTAKWAEVGHNSCNTKVLNNPEYTESIYISSIAQNFYDVNNIQTVGSNSYGEDLMSSLKGLSPHLLSQPNQLESLVKSAQDKYNGQIAFDEDY